MIIIDNYISFLEIKSLTTESNGEMSVNKTSRIVKPMILDIKNTKVSITNNERNIPTPIGLSMLFPC